MPNVGLVTALVVAPVRRSAPHPVWHDWTTPDWIRAFAIAVSVGALVLMSFMLAFLGNARTGWTVIGHQTAPQVEATADLYFSFADMDAQLANVLLTGNDPDFARQRQDALAGFDQRRHQANGDIQRAAADPAAQATVNTALDQLGRYELLAGQVIAINDREHNPPGRPSATVLDLHRQATTLMRDTLNTVQQLTAINSSLMDGTYQAQLSADSSARVGLITTGAGLLTLLVWAQLFLAARSGRRVNPALVLATLLTGWLVVAGTGVLSEEADRLTVAKSSAFDSIIALSHARAVSYDANADESRYLVDPSMSGHYEQEFVTKSGELRHDFDSELHNITFDGELDAADHMEHAYQLYLNDDQHIRVLATQGDLRGAIDFDVSASPGNSNYDFAKFDQALTAVIDVNQRAFDTALHDGESALDLWEYVIPIAVTLLVIGLVVVGVRPRLAEYN